jgi:hypothetical protein
MTLTQIRIALIVNTQKSGQTGYALLFSTDPDLDARKIVQYYKARFQIEFIFRDAKQFMGLCDAQTRDQKRLDFHFNAALSALNWVKCAHFQDLNANIIAPNQHRLQHSQNRSQWQATSGLPSISSCLNY